MKGWYFEKIEGTVIINAWALLPLWKRMLTKRFYTMKLWDFIYWTGLKKRAKPTPCQGVDDYVKIRRGP